MTAARASLRLNAHGFDKEPAMSEHGHRHGDRGHENHEHETNLREVSRRRLWWAMAIILLFLIIEVVGGLITGSLALLADAGHMFSDAAALGLSLFAAWISTRPPTPQ